MPLVAAEDVAECAREIFRRGKDPLVLKNEAMRYPRFSLKGIRYAPTSLIPYQEPAREEMVGRYVPVCGDLLTGPEIAEVFSKHLGEEVAFRYVPPADFRKKSESKSQALGLMFLGGS